MTDMDRKFFTPHSSEAKNPPLGTPENAAWDEFYNTEKKNAHRLFAKASEVLRLCRLHKVKSKL